MEMPASSPSKISPLAIVRILLVVGMFALGAALYGKLPAQIPTHWNFRGIPDSFSPKTYGLWFVPGIAALMTALFPLLSRLDPRAANYPTFRGAWEILQTAIVAFMAYVFVITLVATLHPDQSNLVGRAVVFGIGALFIVIGNSMGKIRQNFFVGLRTPWSLSDPETWQKSQRFGGWAFVLGGIVAMIEAFVWWKPEWVFFITLAIIVVVPIVYSYVVFRSRSSVSTADPSPNTR